MEIEDYKSTIESIADLTPEQKAVLLDDKAITAITTKAKTLIGEARNETTNKTLTATDAKVAELTGIQKNAGEKTSDYYARALEASKQANLATLQEEIKTLKAQKAGATPEDLKILKAEIAKLELEKTEIAKEAENKISSFTFNSEIKSIISGLKFNPAFEDDLIDLLKKQAIEKAREAKTIEVEGVKYITENGISPKYVNGQMVTFESFVTDSLKKYLAAEKPKGNGASDDAGKKDADGIKVEGTTQLKAFQILEEKLKKEGITPQKAQIKIMELTSSEAYKKLPKY